jgi:hypothetical protein
LLETAGRDRRAGRAADLPARHRAATRSARTAAVGSSRVIPDFCGFPSPRLATVSAAKSRSSISRPRSRWSARPPAGRGRRPARSRGTNPHSSRRAGPQDRARARGGDRARAASGWTGDRRRPGPDPGTVGCEPLRGPPHPARIPALDFPREIANSISMGTGDRRFAAPRRSGIGGPRSRRPGSRRVSRCAEENIPWRRRRRFGCPV